MSKILAEISRLQDARAQVLASEDLIYYRKKAIVGDYDDQLAALWAKRRAEMAGATGQQPIPQNPTRIRLRAS